MRAGLGTDLRPRARTIDREMLRSAGEHLGMLAEQAKDSYELVASGGQWGRARREAYARFTKLSRLSREVLEVAR